LDAAFHHTAKLRIQGKTPKTNDGIYALPQGVFSETWDYNEGEKPRPELFRLNKLKRTIVVGDDEKVMKT